MKPEVGAIVWVVPHRRQGKRKELVEHKVVRAGRLYFYCTTNEENSWMERKVTIEDWVERNDYGTQSTVYPTRRAYAQEVQADYIYEKVHSEFSGYSNNKRFSLDQLERIKSILGENNES